MGIDVPEGLPTYHFTFERGGRMWVGDRACDYHGDILRVAATLGTGLPGRMADLVDIALGVYIADRLASRRRGPADRYQLRWTRNLTLQIPVRDVRFWNGTPTECLIETLGWLTEDGWRFDFVPLRNPRSVDIQGQLFDVSDLPIRAALFSGGLDSLAGLCCEMEERTDQSFLLFSGGSNTRLFDIQKSLIGRLKERTRRELVPIVLPFGLHQRDGLEHADERTQRSRGFIYMTLGAAVAMLAGTDELAIYENGVGAINLPYTEAQFGTHSTRATHPRTLSAMSGLVSVVSDRVFAFRSPFLVRTKAQMCGGVVKLGLGDLAGATVSCDGFPRRVRGKPQCGTCTSCLLRRQSLHASGLGNYDDPSAYIHDVTDPSRPIPRQKLHPLNAMRLQVYRLRQALASPVPWRALASTYPELFELQCLADDLTARNESNLREGLLELYRRYCAEWDDFPICLDPTSPKQAA